MAPLRGRKAEPAPLVRALTGGVLAVGGVRYTFHEGEELRADHPLVRKYRDAFAPTGLTSQEYVALRQSYQNKRRILAA